MSTFTIKNVLSDNKNTQEKTYGTTESGIKVKMKKKSKEREGKDKIKAMKNFIEKNYYIEIAIDYLENYFAQFSTKLIENSLELDSFEIIENEKNEVNYEVIISYYTKNKTFDTNSESGNSSNFQIPNVKNYRKIVLNKKGELLKITSKID